MAKEKEIKEEKVQMPDGSTIRLYLQPDGMKLMDIDDIMKAFSNPENKKALQELVSEHAQSVYTPPKEETVKKERKLSDFNSKLKEGLNWNPKKK